VLRGGGGNPKIRAPCVTVEDLVSKMNVSWDVSLRGPRYRDKCFEENLLPLCSGYNKERHRRTRI
jgi:hypothetical protein